MNLTQHGCQTRRERLLAAAQVDQIVITNPRHILYFSGLYNTPLHLNAWGANYLLIDAGSGETTLVIHDGLAKVAEQSAHVDAIHVWEWDEINPAGERDVYHQGMEELNKHLRGGRVGAEAGWLPHGVDVGEVTDLTPVIFRMRRRKDADELDLIREAVRAVEAGHRTARSVLRPGMSELDVYNEVYAAIVREAGMPVLPLGDFVSGERGMMGGGAPVNRVLQAGELMILDIFPLVNGYRADFTVTLSVDGGLTEQQRQIETALHAAIAAGEALLRPGSIAEDIYQAVHATIIEHGFERGLVHHAGHGLGLGHPESPHFVPKSREALVAGDVVTLEPGTYGEVFGARIERNYLITDAGCELLSSHDIHFARG